jgi:beta-barrel assembly-enhancing protease
MTQLPFQIRYFDGQSTQSQRAQLWLKSDFWEIVLDNDDDKYFSEGALEKPTIIRWPLSEIHRGESKGGIITFRFGHFPYQSLECREPDFHSAVLNNYPTQNLINQLGQSVLGSLMKAALAFLAITLGVIALAYFLIVPLLATSLVNVMPQQVEIDLGKQLSESILKESEIDTARSVLLQNFANKVDFESNYPLSFTVVHSNELNAFAIPGGQIVVYDGLLNKIETPEALAGMLAHEAAHVKKRHSLQSIAQQLSRYMFLSLILGDMNALVAVLAENANLFASMSYSRALEQEADQAALASLQKNHLDQMGLVHLFEVLQTVDKAAPKDGTQFFRSHPLTEERLAMARAAAATQPLPQQNEALNAAFGALQQINK